MTKEEFLRLKLGDIVEYRLSIHQKNPHIGVVLSIDEEKETAAVRYTEEGETWIDYKEQRKYLRKLSKLELALK